MKHIAPTKNILALLVVIVMFPTIASGKCPFAKYSTEGTVNLPADVNPEDVKVYFFVEGLNRTTDYSIEGEKEYATPNQTGHFSTEAYMNTSSGYSRILGHRCRKVAKLGGLFIVGPGIHPTRIRVSFQQSPSVIRKQLGTSAVLPTIAIERKAQMAGPPKKNTPVQKQVGM